MTDFELRTSYASDHELLDFAETADWHPENQGLEYDVLGGPPAGWRGPSPDSPPVSIVVAEISDVNNPDYIAVTLGLALSPTSKVFLCFSPDDASVAKQTDKVFKPRANDVIETTNEESNYPGRWLVNNVTESPFSRWVVAVDKAIENT